MSSHLPMLHFGYDRQVTSCLVWIWTSDTLSPSPCKCRHIECSSAPEKRFSLSPFWESLFSLFDRSGWPTSFCVCVPFSVICSDVFLSRDMEVRLVYTLTCLLPLRRNPLMEVPMVIRLDRRPSFMFFIWLIFFLKHFITYK